MKGTGTTIMANATETKKTLDDSDISDLFEHRVSLELTPENARFTRSAGNLISLEVTQPSGKVEFFERIVPVRAYVDFLLHDKVFRAIHVACVYHKIHFCNYHFLTSKVSTVLALAVNPL